MLQDLEHLLHTHPNKFVLVRLTPDERYELEELVSKVKIAAYKRLQAQILLKADISEQGPGWVDEKNK
jgi:hypothetical protein